MVLEAILSMSLAHRSSLSRPTMEVGPAHGKPWLIHPQQRPFPAFLLLTVVFVETLFSSHHIVCPLSKTLVWF